MDGCDSDCHRDRFVSIDQSPPPTPSHCTKKQCQTCFQKKSYKEMQYVRLIQTISVIKRVLIACTLSHFYFLPLLSTPTSLISSHRNPGEPNGKCWSTEIISNPRYHISMKQSNNSIVFLEIIELYIPEHAMLFTSSHPNRTISLVYCLFGKTQ